MPPMFNLILPTQEQMERAATLLIEAHRQKVEFIREDRGDPSETDVYQMRLSAFEGLVLLLNKDKILGEPDVTYPDAEPSPIALTEDHIPALERAIRAEGYTIKVDTETGEVKLYREQK